MEDHLAERVDELLQRATALRQRCQRINEVDGLRVIVDSFSAGHLQGAKVDYVDSLMGAGFTVLNPNAVSSCGCGHSFESAQGGGDAHTCGTGGCSH